MLDELKRLIQLNIYVYSLQLNDEETNKENDYFDELIRRPLSRYKETMYLNLYQTHFSYIKDFKKYAKSYACPKCGKKWVDSYKLNRHELTCDGAITYEYPGGAYHLPPTIFKKLKDEGIVVPQEDRYYPFRATYDIECLLKPLEDDGTPKLQWEAVHELLSVSVCSNVRGYTKPRCFVSEGESSVVVKDMIDYAAVLTAYGCTEIKCFFPYEWMDSLEKLERTELPPASAFYSKVKMTHISEEDYTYCQEVWKDHNMHTMKDFLTWYNNKDVVTMLDAVQRMSDFYKDRQIDMFKDGISVPGLTMKYLFMDIGDTYFTCMDNEDAYKLFKNNIVGGPSIIFHRYLMRENGREPKTCQKVIGYDANALYLWSLMQGMPTGCYIRRRAEEDFKREYSQRVGRMATQWLEWVGYQHGNVIRHKFNNTEKRIGPRQLPVDGFCSDTGEIF
ncbi:uncharacterized protein [Branchiostoma lanceolatum]|uniref:uncharacterized protein n=1 Tax=Branchiostoma lanceolatum TaxID=7740 RepID=UPI003456CBDE